LVVAENVLGNLRRLRIDLGYQRHRSAGSEAARCRRRGYLRIRIGIAASDQSLLKPFVLVLTWHFHFPFFCV
jgi:hypothetical protein